MLKKAVSLIELVFAIVVMGIALAAVPAVSNSAKASSELVSLKDYFNIASFAVSLSAKLPYDTNNLCLSDFKQNSRLAQVCAPENAAVALYEPGDYSLVYRQSDTSRSNVSSGGVLFNGTSALSTLWNSNAISDPRSYYDVFAREHKLDLSKLSDNVNGDVTMSLSDCNRASSKSDIFSVNLADSYNVGSTKIIRKLTQCNLKIQLAGKDDYAANVVPEIVFKAYFGDMGRTESLYRQYLVQINQKSTDYALSQEQTDLVLDKLLEK